jgi:hypothetical protein
VNTAAGFSRPDSVASDRGGRVCELSARECRRGFGNSNEIVCGLEGIWNLERFIERWGNRALEKKSDAKRAFLVDSGALASLRRRRTTQVVDVMR